MATREQIQRELDDNFTAFQKMLPDLSEYSGKYALLRHGELVHVFDSAGDALTYAKDQFQDELYSIQEITTHVVDLGYFSHVMHVETVQPEPRSNH